MKELRAVNPFRCRAWEKHERLEDYVTEETCRQEILSIKEHGQMLPALARTVRDDPDYNYEVICGTRRLFVARHLNVVLTLEVREISDKEAAVLVEIENRQRREISPYERGRSYCHWLRSNIFGSQEELARAIMISPAQVSRLIKLAQLPSVIVNAFASPTDICETWGCALLDAWRDPQQNRQVISRARAIAKDEKRPSAAEVYARLTGAPMTTARGRGRLKVSLGRDVVVRDERGTPLFRIRYHRNTIAFVLPSESTSGIMSEIKTALVSILQPETSQAGVLSDIKLATAASRLSPVESKQVDVH